MSPVEEILDLLQKSRWGKLQVVNGRNQVESQPKALSSITVTLAQNAKHFQAANYMFRVDPFPC